MLRALLTIAAAGVVITGCAGRGDYQTVYFAEQGDYESALREARAAQGSGIDGILFNTPASHCRDYSSLITVLVAKEDFSGAREACADYDKQCAVIPESQMCFIYDMGDLSAAGSDAALAQSLSEDARESLHFRWLMIRDDYEGRGIKRPIY
jgi:hypothetical protein